MKTIQLMAGKKDKLRAGDIVGAITGEGVISAQKVGKINVFDHYSYVAVEQGIAKQLVKQLTENKVKGRAIKVRLV